MATSAGSGVGWWQHPQWKEEEEEAEGEPMGSGSPTSGRRAGRSLDRWNLSPSSSSSSSSSEEMLGDAGLPGELKDSRGPLEEEDDDELDDDLNHLQDLGSLGEAEPASPLLGRAKEGANVGRLGSASHWHPQRDRQQEEEEEEEEEEEAWAEHSEGKPYPELSYEGLYGSEFSTSPEALKDPLALYNSHDKPSRFNSDGAEEELSGNSQVISEEFGRAVVGTLGQEGSSREFLEERDFSSESQKSPENLGPASLVGSIRWSCSPLEGLSLEGFQNSPSLDSETFPESSWMENMAHPEGNGLEVATSSTVHDPQTPEQPRGSHLDVREATGGSGALIQRDRQPPERARALGAEPPRWLLTKIGQRPRPVNPQRAPSRRKTGGLGYHASIRASQSTPVMSDPLPYGQGQLNHPLPDLSKVEPRVRFPRDPQSYHPPRGRTLPARSKDSGKPVVFKSPAEIVREVLLSSGEGPPQKHPTAAVSVIPEELKSPQQATELVKQLQEDYRKLLTKYAEAENTIDRLRLGAKVRLYTDPPKPSHGVQMGTMSPASQVMTFSIPQIRAAEVTGGPDPAPDAVAVSQGSSGPPGASASPCAPQGPGLHKEDGFASPDQPFSGEELTWVLAAQASKFWKQVESLEGLIRAGRLTPQDQLKGFARLKGVQDALEGAYLQARDDHRQRQKHEDLEGVLSDFDPDRALEGEIFRQGMWLEELKERIEQSTARSSPEVASPPPSPWLPQDPQGQMGPPAPSPQALIPDGPTPYPEAAIPESSRHGDQLDLEVSSGSDEPAEDGQGLPEPLRIRQREVERGLDHLLDHYRSFKALPGAFSLEQLHPEGEEFSPEEVDGAAAGEAGRTDVFLKNMSRNQGTQLSLSSMREPRLSDASQRRLSERSQEMLRHISCAPGGQREGPISLESAEKSRIFASGLGRSPGKPPGRGSPPSSMASVAGSSVPESVAPKPFRKTSTASSESPRMVPSEAHAEPLGDDVGMSSHKQDLRMVSPETDSGFVGSEASRRSPLAPVPKSHATPLRSCGVLGRAAVAKGAAAFLDPRWKVPRAVEPSGTDASPRHALPAGDLQRQRLAQGHPFHTSAPPGIASKVEPSGESTPTDSEAEGGLKAYAPPPEDVGRLPGPSAALPSRAKRVAPASLTPGWKETERLQRCRVKCCGCGGVWRRPFADLTAPQSIHPPHAP
ncbi:hypothetical protein JRQ81_009064 [Phrynocephalus forsythii]|uniref:AT-hook-containing transcription factor n=1 Tax=Phrynocephalus forsythii TaxID=171643 RepID=A0A9Q0XB60_9SAUR|nr:hypothetical protein JRQ81_009064 [Phrynocephalus forsythii]